MSRKAGKTWLENFEEKAREEFLNRTPLIFHTGREGMKRVDERFQAEYKQKCDAARERDIKPHWNHAPEAFLPQEYFKHNNMSTTEKQLTRGQQVMDVNFNVAQRKDISDIKQACAGVFDLISQLVTEKLDQLNKTVPADVEEDFKKKQLGNDISRLAAMAKTDIENACMHAVKAVTR